MRLFREKKIKELRSIYKKLFTYLFNRRIPRRNKTEFSIRKHWFQKAKFTIGNYRYPKFRRLGRSHYVTFITKLFIANHYLQETNQRETELSLNICFKFKNEIVIP